MMNTWSFWRSDSASFSWVSWMFLAACLADSCFNSIVSLDTAWAKIALGSLHVGDLAPSGLSDGEWVPTSDWVCRKLRWRWRRRDTCNADSSDSYWDSSASLPSSSSRLYWHSVKNSNQFYHCRFLKAYFRCIPTDQRILDETDVRSSRCGWISKVQLKIPDSVTDLALRLLSVMQGLNFRTYFLYYAGIKAFVTSIRYQNTVVILDLV